MLAKLKEESQQYIGQYHSHVSKHDTEMNKMKKYLLESVRRVKYLVEEKKKLEEAQKSNKKYIFKLEYQLGTLFLILI